MLDLSVIIPARNEMFLNRTIEDVLVKSRARTEVIVILDGSWPTEELPKDSRITVIYHNKSVGQRAAVNEGAKISRAKYIMKLDAHCVVDEGFDVKLIADCQPNYTVIPRMYNLYGFDWRCKKCDWKKYQSPTPEKCPACGGEVYRDMVWTPNWKKVTDSMCFDKDLHFQYFGEFNKRKEAIGDITETMSNLGACYFMERAWYWKLGGLEEEWGSWGQMGTEISCKTWLSGGRQVVNKKTWFSHLFRTQGGDFGFPYPQSGNQIEHARKRSKEFFKENNWKGQVKPLSWLVEKFWPVKGWTQKDLDQLKGKPLIKKELTKGIIYYTDNQLKLSIAHACKNHTKQIAQYLSIPIVSASLKPMKDMGKNIHIKLERGYLAYFTQILAALEASDADIIYFCEHDWLYHPTHFEFIPPTNDSYYYNDNWWRVRIPDGHSVHYDTHLLPGIVAYRELLISWYRKAVELTKNGQFSMKTGFEPGTHHRAERLDDHQAIGFQSAFPNLDLRHTNNLTKTKWKQSEFRNQKSCQGWIESKDIPGWGYMPQVLKDLHIV